MLTQQAHGKGKGQSARRTTQHNKHTQTDRCTHTQAHSVLVTHIELHHLLFVSLEDIESLALCSCGCCRCCCCYSCCYWMSVVGCCPLTVPCPMRVVSWRKCHGILSFDAFEFDKFITAYKNKAQEIIRIYANYKEIPFIVYVMGQ